MTQQLTRLQALSWGSLADLAIAPRAHPLVRREADRLLLARLGRLSLGESISLARRASRAVLAELRRHTHAFVLRAVLDNPRAAEEDAVAIASAEGAPPEVLAALAEHPRWGERERVLAALVVNRRTPARGGLHAAQRLSPPTLRRLQDAEGIPPLVCVAIARRLGESAGEPGPAIDRPRGRA